MIATNVQGQLTDHERSKNYTILNEADFVPFKTIKKFSILIFYPNSKFRIIWDIMIIILVLWNWIYTPFQFAYLSDNVELYVNILDKLMDFLFICDLLLQFFFAYQEGSSGEIIDSPK